MKTKKTRRTPEEISEAKQTLKKHDKDVGSAEVQIANLTGRILHLTGHMSSNKNDKHSRRGLIGLVSKRRRLLKYLRSENAEAYGQVTTLLGLRK